MLEELIGLILPPIISICELMGIFVVSLSALQAFWNYCKGLVTHVPLDVKFDLANGLATSLEFKMAAEILKTVLVRDLNELVVLGAVVLLRLLGFRRSRRYRAGMGAGRRGHYSGRRRR